MTIGCVESSGLISNTEIFSFTNKALNTVDSELPVLLIFFIYLILRKQSKQKKLLIILSIVTTSCSIKKYPICRQDHKNNCVQ